MLHSLESARDTCTRLMRVGVLTEIKTTPFLCDSDLQRQADFEKEKQRIYDTYP